jgi:hypothetical protein
LRGNITHSSLAGKNKLRYPYLALISWSASHCVRLLCLPRSRCTHSKGAQRAGDIDGSMPNRGRYWLDELQQTKTTAIPSRWASRIIRQLKKLAQSVRQSPCIDWYPGARHEPCPAPCGWQSPVRCQWNLSFGKNCQLPTRCIGCRYEGAPSPTAITSAMLGCLYPNLMLVEMGPSQHGGGIYVAVPKRRQSVANSPFGRFSLTRTWRLNKKTRLRSPIIWPFSCSVRRQS